MPATQYTDSLEPYLPGCIPLNDQMNTLDTFEATFNNGQVITVTRQCLQHNYLENASGHFISSYRVTEPSLFDAVIKEAEELTDVNNHNEAYIVLCALIVDINNLAEMFKGMITIQNRFGYMPNEFMTKRRELYDTMMSAAKAQLTEEQFNRFYGAT